MCVCISVLNYSSLREDALHGTGLCLYSVRETKATEGHGVTWERQTASRSAKREKHHEDAGDNNVVEPGAADVPRHPRRLCRKRVWGTAQPPLRLVTWGRGAEFLHWCKLLLLGWERLMPRAYARFYCLLLHPCKGRWRGNLQGM